ncbi:MAG: hypothetical protein C0473_00530 [Cyanobacteria bacterium DS3.002]|nr:hypothetical protein [Cyanobacteria bacterium DS3.002]MBA4049444.1 hypothetical protein [Cyanobacteria bacterium DS2.008]MBA4075024.1 hypothetical protein [Cyanobacteria bacterium PR.023]
MLFKGEGYRLRELSEVPSTAGVYAWYYQIELSDHDILQCTNSLQAAPLNEREGILRDFLHEKLFQFYLEAPYTVEMSGQMKPNFCGTAFHRPRISDDLVTRLCEQPERLSQLKGLLCSTVPFFASPIYIGVALNLRKRLQRHKYLIHKYSPSGEYDVYSPEQTGEPDEVADHSFAMEITQTRNFITEFLVAFTMTFEVGQNLHVDLENILNRINYPLCGRN